MTDDTTTTTTREESTTITTATGITPTEKPVIKEEHTGTQPPTYRQQQIMDSRQKRATKGYEDVGECHEYCHEYIHCFGACHNNRANNHNTSDAMITVLAVITCGLIAPSTTTSS